MALSDDEIELYIEKQGKLFHQVRKRLTRLIKSKDGQAIEDLMRVEDLSMALFGLTHYWCEVCERACKDETPGYRDNPYRGAHWGLHQEDLDFLYGFFYSIHERFADLVYAIERYEDLPIEKQLAIVVEFGMATGQHSPLIESNEVFTRNIRDIISPLEESSCIGRMIFYGY